MSVLNGIQVLDCHHHVGTHSAVDRGNSGGDSEAGDDGHEQREVSTRLATMDASGIDQAVVIPGHTYLRPNGNADTARVNDQIARYRDLHPARFPAAMGVVEPLHGAASFGELHRIKDELGLVGVSFHARFQGIATNSAYLVALVREMRRLELFPYIHSLGVVTDEAWWKVQDLAEAVPDAPILALDGFTTSEHAREAIRVAEKTPNIYFDTSATSNLEWVLPVIEAAGPERVVFGTNTYSTVKASRPGSRPSVLEALTATDRLDEPAKRLILGDNIRRLLKLAG